MVYDRSMEMDGPCAVNRCMTDGKLENLEFFFDFFGPSRTFTCWGYVQFFDTCNVYYHLSINITRINLLKTKGGASIGLFARWSPMHIEPLRTIKRQKVLRVYVFIELQKFCHILIWQLVVHHFMT